MTQRLRDDLVDCSVTLCVGSTHHSFHVCFELFGGIHHCQKQAAGIILLLWWQAKTIYKNLSHICCRYFLFYQLRHISMCDDRKLGKWNRDSGKRRGTALKYVTSGAHGHFSLIRQFTIVSRCWEKEWSAFPPSCMWSREQPPSKWGGKVGEGECRANTTLSRNTVWSWFGGNGFTSEPKNESPLHVSSHQDVGQTWNIITIWYKE